MTAPSAGRPFAACTSQVRVRYAETDQMGIAHHAGYFAWFEVGRTDLLRGQGMPYTEIEARGVRFPVVAAEARYERPARYDDVLEIRTTVAAVGGAQVSFAYEVVHAATAERIATGLTRHAAVDATGRPVRLPADVRRRLVP